MTKNTYTAVLEIEVPKELGWIRGEEAKEYLKEAVKELLKTNNLNFRSSYDTRNGRRISAIGFPYTTKILTVSERQVNQNRLNPRLFEKRKE
tara:strand:- start:661 stop:936 length:276 start_codon:yes stop_codon:yes gene_type:complete